MGTNSQKILEGALSNVTTPRHNELPEVLAKSAALGITWKFAMKHFTTEPHPEQKEMLATLRAVAENIRL